MRFHNAMQRTWVRILVGIKQPEVISNDGHSSVPDKFILC